MLSQFFWSSLSRNLFWIHHPFIVFSLNLIFSLCNSFVLSLLNNLYLVVFQVPDPGFLIQKTISKILFAYQQGIVCNSVLFPWVVCFPSLPSVLLCRPSTDLQCLFHLHARIQHLLSPEDLENYKTMQGREGITKPWIQPSLCCPKSSFIFSQLFHQPSLLSLARGTQFPF